MLVKIHNNPKLEGPRMSVIMPQELEDKCSNCDELVDIPE